MVSPLPEPPALINISLPVLAFWNIMLLEPFMSIFPNSVPAVFLNATFFVLSITMLPPSMLRSPDMRFSPVPLTISCPNIVVSPVTFTPPLTSNLPIGLLVPIPTLSVSPTIYSVLSSFSVRT